VVGSIREDATMTVGRKAMASVAIGLIAATSFVSTALAKGVLGTCALTTGCIEVDAPDVVVGTVDEVGEDAGKVLDDAKEGTDKATGGRTEPVTDPVIDKVNDTLDLTPGGSDPVKHTKDEKRRSATNQDTSATAAAAASQRKFDMMAARETRRSAFDGRFERAVSFAPPSEPGLAERLAQAALDAAKAFTFPAILIGFMVGFILVQNRIDHTDPKLALAPVSSEQDYLSFS
jgi:hypothetical protein